MRTKEDYMKDLSKMKKNIFYDGERIDRLDERHMPCINTIGTTFDVVDDPKFKDLILAKSHLTGEIINRFTHIHQNTDDLHKKQDMTRKICQIFLADAFNGVWDAMEPTRFIMLAMKQINRIMVQPIIMKILKSGWNVSKKKT